MREADRQAFGVALAAMAATFRQELSKPAMQGYWIGLRDLPLAVVEDAIAKAMRDRKFMPVPTELRELAHAGELSPAMRSEKAWLVYCRAVDLIGPYQSIQFDDPVLNATAKAMGRWSQCDESPRDGYLHKRFVDVYQALMTTGVSEDEAAALPGIHAGNNAGLSRVGLSSGQLRSLGLEPVPIASGLPKLPVGIAGPKRREMKSLSSELLANIGRPKE